MTRIIGGTAGGQRLTTLPGANTRPTSDRVREAVFSTIASWLGAVGDQALAGCSFVDFYAGSGAIGLEAASRGAAPVLLVESHPAAARVIAKNVAATGLPAQVVAASVAPVVARPPQQPFDVVWADPPYGVTNAEIEGFLAQLVTNGWLADDALVVVERSARMAPVIWPPSLGSWSKRYGETVLHYAQYDAAAD